MEEVVVRERSIHIRNLIQIIVNFYRVYIYCLVVKMHPTHSDRLRAVTLRTLLIHLFLILEFPSLWCRLESKRIVLVVVTI